MCIRHRLVPALLAAACASAPCAAQLRVVQWNITNYSSGRVADFQTALYGSFSGRSVAPDVIIAEEIVSSVGAQNFLNLLNSAPGSPGGWAMSYVPNGGDTDNTLFFRTAKITFVSVLTLDQNTGSGPGQPPRDNQRWRVRLVGFTSAGAELYLYGAHMKAGSNPSDRDRRVPECQRIRDDAEALPVGANFILGGDYNMQSWNETGYQILVQPLGAPDGSGRFFDPIKSPGYVSPSPSGSWNGNNAYHFVHTQDPATCDAACGTGCGGGGMDDRHDQLLLSSALIDGQGLAYLGNPNIAYSTSTWNDPNHSYRSWGNDGTSFNCRLTVTGNAMVGAAIAQALVNSADGLGHLPVFLDLQVPAKVSSPLVVDFGTVMLGAPASVQITIANATNVALWSRAGNGTGIDDLDYTLAASTGFTAPPGSFSSLAGVPGNTHTLTMSTATPGPVSGTLTITSDDPDQPARVVTLMGNVENPPPECPCDWDQSGSINSQDFFDFLTSFFAFQADFNHDGVTNSQDYFDFLNCFFTLPPGC